jgi:hypothetical protein
MTGILMSQISARELDLIIKELERLNDCYNKLSERIDTKLEKKSNKIDEKWKFLLIFGSYGFTMFVLGLLLKIHFGV